MSAEIDNLKAALQSVVVTFGSSWTWRKLTSARDAEARTYGASTAMTAQMVNQTVVEEYNDKTGGFVKRARAELKVTDAVSLTIGDEVAAPDSTIWHIDGKRDAADIDGILRYLISRDVTLKSAADRGGGV